MVDVCECPRENAFKYFDDDNDNDDVDEATTRKPGSLLDLSSIEQ